ncbi:MAG: hypothetical protein IJ131_08525, partial [Eggerthellaceae bacterium]|nr:hypothetical protein [Eggerthellaceae bacterium]
DQTVISYAIAQLQEAGVIDKDAYVNNLCTGQASGSPDAATSITIGHYYNLGTGEVEYGDAEKAAVAQADNVVCFSKMFSLPALQPTGAIYQGISQVLADAHAAGAKFVLLSGTLPYDAARYTDADAIVLAYMSSGIAIDPTDRDAQTGSASAYNANLSAGIEAMFDNKAPTGTLPVNIPVMATGEDGTVSYSSNLLYERGFGLSYAYQFTAGMEGTHEGGSSAVLDFATNARNDKLTGIVVDGAQVDAASYTSTWGQTRLQLGADFLNSLPAGEHVLQAVYDYDGQEVVAQTTFATTAVPDPSPSDPSSSDSASSKSSSSGAASSGQQQPSKPAGTSSSAAATSTTSKTSAAQTAATSKQAAAKTADEAPLAVLATVLLLSMAGVGLAQRRMHD